MLRTAGAETYDKWVNHEIPFNDPAVATALAEVGKILKNHKFVNGGYGDVKTIASTSFQDAGQPVLDGTCYMHRQASFYAANWPEGTEVGRGGEVWAFYLPSIDASAPSRSSVAARSPRPSPTVRRSRRSRPTSPRPSGPTSARRPVVRVAASRRTTTPTRRFSRARSTSSRRRR